TCFKNIEQIKPSHNLIFDLKRNTMKTYRYYHLQIPVNNERYDRKKALGFADDIRDLLIDSVRLRLRSDVNIGSCLSGGLDSSSIVAIINLLLAKKGVEREHIGKRQKTFTASYRRESDIDESFYARLMIKHTKADGHFIYPDSRALWNELTKLKFHQDEPFGSTSMFAQYKVTQLASGYVKVLLDGQGGDEIFAGYPGYDAVYLADRLRSMDLKGMIHFMLSRIKEHRDGKVFSAFFKGASYMLIPDHAKKYLLKQNVAGILKQIPQSKRFQERFKIVKNKFIFRLNQRLGYDETLYSLPQLLHYEDRNGMAHSLEARVPFIDHRLVELALRIPAVYKMYGGWRKYILRMAMRDLLPEPILWRKDKKGFITPEKKWLFGPGSPVLDMVKTRKIKQYSGYWIWRLFMVNTFTQSYG
ncbi:MAG: asparagine synthase, partial [Spirochaetes bacterium]|nr:asparagine synthase [Spirochaetota bacterium]